MPAKHLEGTTEYNEAGSLRGMNNQKLWDEINIFQKIYLFLLSFVNTEQWGSERHLRKYYPRLPKQQQLSMPYICIMQSSSPV